MIKVFFITLLIVSVFSETITIDPVNQTDSSSSKTTSQNSASESFTQIPIDYFEPLHSFIQYIIRDAFPGIENSSLINARYKNANTPGDIIFVYTFLQIVDQANASANKSNSANEISYFVFGTSNNTQFLLYDGDNFSRVYLWQQNNQSEQIVGGFSPIDIANFTLDQQDAVNFILANVPTLNDWTLVSARSQVVSGINYCFSYKQSTTDIIQQYCVWSQLWNNGFMQLTLPDGTKIVRNDNANSSANSNSTSSYNATLNNSSSLGA